MALGHWFQYRLRCKLGFHCWSYGGYKVTLSNGNYSIMGYRVCILCVPYVRQRWRHGWGGDGKAKWVKMSSEEFRDKNQPEMINPGKGKNG